MSHSTVSYANLPYLQAHAAALADSEFYCGSKLWAAIKRTAREEGADSLWLGLTIFVGISGYPAHAIVREFCPEVMQDEGYTAFYCTDETPTTWVRSPAEGGAA